MCVRVSAVSHCPVGRVVDGLLVVRKIEVRYTTVPTVLKQLNSIPPSKHRPRANYCLMCTHVLYFGGVAAHRSKTQLLPFTACLFAHDASFVLVETVGWARHTWLFIARDALTQGCVSVLSIRVCRPCRVAQTTTQRFR